MVKIVNWEEPERPWFKIGYASMAQEAQLRMYAAECGYKDLRGFWKFMESKDWDYYDIIKMSYGR